jgi:hypothetical protein
VDALGPDNSTAEKLLPASPGSDGSGLKAMPADTDGAPKEEAVPDAACTANDDEPAKRRKTDTPKQAETPKAASNSDKPVSERCGWG